MKIDYKSLLLNILIPVLLGSLVGFITSPSSSYSDLIMILPYVLTLILLVFFSKKNDAPRALGEIYDKGKR